MKALLWIVFVAAVAVNVATSFAFDGGKQIAISVSTGAVVIGSALCLFLMRTKRS